MKSSTIVLLCISFTAPWLNAQEASAPAVAPPAAVSPQQEFQAIEDRWSEAVSKRDQFGLELVLAPELVDISATGDVTNRNQQIVALFKRDSPTLSLEQKVISVRALAANTVAVVNGTYVLHTKTGGIRKDEKGIFTHVFTHVRIHWLCVSSQRTLVVEQVLGKPKAATQRDSILPWKVPLIYDGRKKP